MHAIDNALFKIAKLLIRHGAKLDSVDSKGRTALVRAISYNKDHPLSISQRRLLVQLLLDNGADLQKPCHEGLTPLHYASNLGYGELLRILLGGGDPRLTTLLEDPEFEFPIQYCVSASRH
jgi:ankyrin repeat protein